MKLLACKMFQIAHQLQTGTAMSYPNGLQSQKLFHCFDQGRTLNDILMNTAR